MQYRNIERQTQPPPPPLSLSLSFYGIIGPVLAGPPDPGTTALLNTCLYTFPRQLSFLSVLGGFQQSQQCSSGVSWRADANGRGHQRGNMRTEQHQQMWLCDRKTLLLPAAVL